MKNCSFASVDQCHQGSFVKTCGLRSVKLEEKTILELRSQVDCDAIQTICKHHEQTLLVKFSSLIKKCADPFNEHLTAKTKSLRIVTPHWYSKSQYLHGKVVPGQKLCPTCFIRLNKSNLQSDSGNEVAGDVDKEITVYESEDRNIQDKTEAGPSGFQPSNAIASAIAIANANAIALCHQ
jgi:hypothetical protein